LKQRAAQSKLSARPIVRQGAASGHDVALLVNRTKYVRTRMEVMLRVEANCQPRSDQIADHLVAFAGYSGELSMYEPTTHANRRSMIWEI
jgi:hypothetical protein